MNIDDNLDTHGGLNDQTDTNPSYEDFAFGGAGRDVMLANTAGDRMVDWIGEFNTYVVPFPPFGMPTRSTQLLPNLPQYLYDLSKSAGADQTLAARYASAATRNGEPFGELGLIEQQDAAAGDQRGNSRDAQQGNQQGTRDVNISAGTQPINSPGTCCKISPLTAATQGTETVTSVTTEQLAPVVAAAKQLWIDTGVLT